MRAMLLTMAFAMAVKALEVSSDGWFGAFISPKVRGGATSERRGSKRSGSGLSRLSKPFKSSRDDWQNKELLNLVAL